MTARKLSIIEGKWYPDRHVSVHEIYNPLLTLAGGTNWSCHYESFTTGDAFDKAVKMAMSKNKPKTILISCHGLTDQLQGYHDFIGVDSVIESFNSVAGVTKKGVIFGSCLFGNESNMTKVLASCRRLEWVAGYTRSPDWVNSALLETYFIRNLLYPDYRSLRGKNRNQLTMVEYCHTLMKSNMSGLAKKLGFQIYLKQPNNESTKVLDFK